MFNASRQSETVSNAQTGDEEMFARPFDVRMPRVRNFTLISLPLPRRFCFCLLVGLFF